MAPFLGFFFKTIFLSKNFISLALFVCDGNSPVLAQMHSKPPKRRHRTISDDVGFNKLYEKQKANSAYIDMALDP